MTIQQLIINLVSHLNFLRDEYDNADATNVELKRAVLAEMTSLYQLLADLVTHDG